jgi:hypothetical protein
MLTKLKFRPSLEAISYQGKSLLFNELVLAFQTFIEGQDFSDVSFQKLGLGNITKRHTGLTVDFVLDRTGGGENAYSIFPLLNLNSPLVDLLRTHGLEGKARNRVTLAQVRRFTDELRGTIDLDKGRVSGVFSKLPSQVGVGLEFFTSGRYLAEEIAAAALHEIGHIFTYFEKLTLFATTNMVLSSAIEDLRTTVDQKVRLELVFQTAKSLNVNIDEPEELAKPGLEPEIFQSVFLKAQMESALHATHGSRNYDLRSIEFLADQFAIRHGAGRFLAIVTHKTNRFNNHPSMLAWSRYVLVEALKTVSTMVLLVKLPIVTAPVLGVMLATDGLDQNTYDEPGERLARIKQDLVQCLKDTRLPKAMREQLLIDVEVVDAVREDVQDRRTVFNFIWTALHSRRREQFNQKRLQQDLEKLVNNDLFVAASKLQSMA